LIHCNIEISALGMIHFNEEGNAFINIR